MRKPRGPQQVVTGVKFWWRYQRIPRMANGHTCLPNPRNTVHLHRLRPPVPRPKQFSYF